MSWSASAWQKVVFSDEKRFALEGPDGHASYWSDKRIPRRIYSRRARGGGTVMFWAAFSYYGTTKIVPCDGNLNAKEYINVLDDALCLFR